MIDTINLKDVPYLLRERNVIQESLSYHEYAEKYGYREYEENVSSFQTDHFYVGLSRSASTMPFVIEIEEERPHLEMNFTFSGDSSIRLHRQKFQFDIKGGQQALYALPDFRGRIALSNGRVSRHALGIHLSERFILDTFGNELPVLSGFMDNIARENPAVLGQKSLPISPPMHHLLNEMIHCPYTGILKKGYYEAKIIELLTLQIDFAQKFTDQKRHDVRLSKNDISKLYYAKELLLQHMEEPCTIINLSKMVGMNDYKLKLGFKELFGTTIFSYFSEMRMAKAKSLLLDSDLTVAEVAYRIGYKNPQHFTVAFKRKFGMLPSGLKG